MSKLPHTGFAAALSSSVLAAGATFRKAICGAAVVATFAVSAAPAWASAEGSATGSFQLRLVVPVLCRVSYTAGGGGADGAAGAVDLGQIGEFCNDGAGYKVEVDYAPGTLRGAVLQLGTDRVVLDGSGQAVISQSAGARIRTRELVATPGANGFDSPQLSFQIRPTAV
jgi:hypothetical protein